MPDDERDTMRTFVPNEETAPDQMQTAVPSTGDTVSGDLSAPRSTNEEPVLAQLQALAAANAIDFTKISKLGEGGMGLVCRAHQVSLDRPVALKVLKPELAKNGQLVERFVREARAMAKINHPNVVQGYAVGEADGLNWVAMELIDGQSMQDVLDANGPLELKDAVLATIVAAEALQHAHDLKMIHRDIKPDNILVTTDGQLKVADLGLAKATDEDMSMTQSGTGLGTPHYMPPEQARNAKHVDERSDIYALGCTLYHFLVGGVPFQGSSVVELIMNKEKGSFPPVRKRRSDCPERLALTVEKMMAAKPEHRYASMTQVIADLQKLGLAGESFSFIPGAMPVRRQSNSPSTAAVRSAPTAKAMSDDRVAKLAGKRKSASPGASAPGGKSGPKIWYMQLTTGDGRIRKVKAPHGEVLAKLRSGSLDPAAVKIASTAKGPYLQLAEVPAFSKELEKRGRKKVNDSRSNKGLASEMAKIDKQYGRRKWWNLLRRFRDGTLGLLGLVLYLAAIGVVGILAFVYLREPVMDFIGSGAAETETVENAE